MSHADRPWIVILFGAEYVTFGHGDTHCACLGCGERWRVALPSPIDIVLAIHKLHERRHKGCRKRWEARGCPAVLPPSELR